MHGYQGITTSSRHWKGDYDLSRRRMEQLARADDDDEPSYEDYQGFDLFSEAAGDHEIPQFREPSDTDRYNERLIRANHDRSLKSAADKATKVLEIFREMQRNQVAANAITYAELVSGLLRNHQFDLAFSILQEPPVIPPPSQSSPVVATGDSAESTSSTTAAVSSSSEDEAEDDDDDDHSDGAVRRDDDDAAIAAPAAPTPFRPDAPLYELAIRAHLKRGSLDQAYSVLSVMRQAGVHPTPNTFLLLLKKPSTRANLLALESFATTEQHIEALHKELQAHGEALCSTALDALLLWFMHSTASPSDAAFTRAFELLQYMSAPANRSRTPPTIDTYATLITACSNVERVERVRELEFELKNAGIAPDHRIQRAKLRLLASTSSLEEAHRYLHDLIKSSSSASNDKLRAPVFNELMQLFLQQTDDAQALRNAFLTLRLMRKHAIEPDCETYTTLMLGCAMFNDWSHEPRFDLAPPGFPNRLAFNIMLRVAAQHGKIDNVRAMMRNMRRNGMRLDTTAYNCLIKARCVNNDLDAAIETYRSMRVQPNAQTFEILFASPTISVDRACKLWVEMETRGIHANASHYARLLRLCCAANMEELAVRFGEQYLRSTTAAYNPKVFAPLESAYPRRFTELIATHRDLLEQRVAATAQRRPRRKLFRTLAKPLPGSL